MRGGSPSRKTRYCLVALLMFQGLSWILDNVFLPTIVIWLRLIPGAIFRHES